MDIETACTLISGVVYKPGYRFIPSDATNRFEGTVKVRIDYQAPNYNRENAPSYSVPADSPSASFLIRVSTLESDLDLYRCLLDHCLTIEAHEAREAFRVSSLNYWGPFHPHTVEGMKNWGDEVSDFTFGIA